MTPAEELRTAAQQIRAVALDALSDPDERWTVDQSPDYGLVVASYMPGDVDPADGYISTSILAQFAYGDVEDNRTYANALPVATHIAAWQPTVALAVADWLENQAETVVLAGDPTRVLEVGLAFPLAVARAFLGGAS